MKEQFLLANQVITVDVPDNYGALLLRKEQLLTEKAALKERLTRAKTKAQNYSIGQDIGAVKAELKLVNKKLSGFKQGKSTRQKLKERQQAMLAKGREPFPSHGTDSDRYEWAVGLLNYAMDAIRESNVDEDIKTIIAAGLASVTWWEKLQLEEAAKAEQVYNQEVA